MKINKLCKSRKQKRSLQIKNILQNEKYSLCLERIRSIKL